MPHPHQPGIGVRASGTQTPRCGKDAAGDGVVPAVHVDGDELAMMVRLNKMADVPIVYLVAEATRLLGRPADWRCHLSDPFRRAFFLPMQSYHVAVILDNKKGAAYMEMESGEGIRPGDAGPERQKGRMAVQGEAIADVAKTSPCVLRSSVQRRPALPLSPAPSPSPTRTSRGWRAEPCGCGPWA